MNPFYSPTQDKITTQGNLPHWSQQGKIHFVTFRLADSLPKECLEQIQRDRRKWDSCHRQPCTDQEWREYYCLFSERVENWLDAGHGGCLLSQPQYAEVVADALRHFENQRYLLDHWIIMLNHVHVLLMPVEPYTLEKILHSWKSFTANAINFLRHSDGQVWLHESFDHIVRSQKQLEHFRQYILGNWQQAGYKAVISKQMIQQR